MNEYTPQKGAEISKYEQALHKYNLQLDDEAVKAAVNKIINEKVAENDTDEIRRFLFGSIELTSLLSLIHI